MVLAPLDRRDRLSSVESRASEDPEIARLPREHGDGVIVARHRRTVDRVKLGRLALPLSRRGESDVARELLKRFGVPEVEPCTANSTAREGRGRHAGPVNRLAEHLSGVRGRRRHSSASATVMVQPSSTPTSRSASWISAGVKASMRAVSMSGSVYAEPTAPGASEPNVRMTKGRAPGLLLTRRLHVGKTGAAWSEGTDGLRSS